MTSIPSTSRYGIEIDNTAEDPRHRAPLVVGGLNFTDVTDAVVNVAQRPTTLGWKIAFACALSFLAVLGLCLIYLLSTGVGVWGNNQPNGWAFDIINFVFWVGIGHAGTLISAVLFLFKQNWRTGINRFAEAMTIFAVICAALFPGIHVGRAWLAYWLAPVPNQMSMWPQFRSPLLWDVFAVGTYASVSTLFWYMGMIPDIATLRDRSTSRFKQMAYGFLSLGWTGSCRHWHRYERAYLLLAALCTPLVLSVHSVVSFDFATSQLPGWHTTIFPPYFVAGAIYGGFAMVLNLAVPARAWFGLKDIITLRHIDNCCKIMATTGMIVSYAYGMEFFVAWYSGNHYERFTFWNRAFGPFAWSFWVMIWCNAVIPHFMWFKTFRTNMILVFICATFANIGMWFERWEIILTSLTRDFLPSSWWTYRPTLIDDLMLAGSFGLFFTLFLLFCRFLPVVAMAEVRSVMPQAHPHADGENPHDAQQADYQPDEHYRPAPSH